MNTEDEKVVLTMCSTHCGGACLLKVHVKNGVITRIETDDGEEPQLRGCLRGRAMRQRVYAPDRIKHPLKRTGDRGEGKFERISWDEALDAVASELKRVKEQYGPASIFFRGGGGNTTIIHSSKTMQRLLSLFGGYTTTWGSSSYEAALFASAASYGTIHVANTREDLVNSRLIILWGCDPATTIHGTNASWYLIQAKEKGIKIISVDPRYNDTAAILADQWIPIRPSTDAAMLIAMAYYIVKENLHDQAFLDRYTAGFDRYLNYLMGRDDGVVKTPSWAEAITGVPAATIESLAKEYATTKPAALIAGIAPGRTAYGEQYHRAAITLAAMTGNIGVHGGEAAGRSLGNPYPFKMGPSIAVPPNPVDEVAPVRKIILKNYSRWGSCARIHISKMSDAILKGKAGGYPSDYKLLYIENCNPVNQLPYTKRWRKALNKLEFMVVQEQFITATAQYADVVLPVSTYLERNDIKAGYSPPFYGLQNKVIEPLHEAKSQLEIANLLADRLGIQDYNNKTDEEWIKEIVKGSTIPDYQTFKEKAVHHLKLKNPYVSFKLQIEDPERNPFPTPSGRIEIYSEQLASMDDPFLPPIPKYFEPWEGPNDLLTKKYPLQLINKHFKRRAHSQLETLPWLRELQPQTLEISTLDAKARGVSDGDLVRVFNDRGVVIVPARVTGRIMPGVVNLPEGAWYAPDEMGLDRGGCTNTLSRDMGSPCGALVTNTCLVQVEKA